MEKQPTINSQYLINLENKKKSEPDENKFSEFMERTKGIIVDEVIKLFNKEFGGSRATFFRYKKNWKANKRLTYKETFGIDTAYRRKFCYFCSSPIQLCVHHINFIHADDVKENRVVLCKTCHQKIHALANPKVRAYVFDVTLKIENEEVMQ